FAGRRARGRAARWRDDFVGDADDALAAGDLDVVGPERRPGRRLEQGDEQRAMPAERGPSIPRRDGKIVDAVEVRVREHGLPSDRLAARIDHGAAPPRTNS